MARDESGTAGMLKGWNADSIEVNLMVFISPFGRPLGRLQSR